MTTKIFIIAGEPSGDSLGANLISDLKNKSAHSIEFSGVGGAKMQAEGFRSLTPMNELCVMGLVEVISQLPRLIKLINSMVEEIEKFKPDIVVTIDLPDFNFAVASRLKKRGISNAKIVHYVAPSVWAWRPKRANKISTFLDGLMCLFPFEPQYFPKIKAVCVGHPMAATSHKGNKTGFREQFDIPSGAKTLGLFFGSRPAEISKHAPLLLNVAEAMHEQFPDLHVIAPTLPHLEYEIYKATESLKMPKFVISNPDKKHDAFAACDAALAVSGTIGLELALHRVPHVITYKMNPITWIIVRYLSKTKYAHLANIILEAPVIPEFLQGKAQAFDIGRELMKLFKIESERNKQTNQTNKLKEILSIPAGSPTAADFVLSFLKGQ